MTGKKNVKSICKFITASFDTNLNPYVNFFCERRISSIQN